MGVCVCGWVYLGNKGFAGCFPLLGVGRVEVEGRDTSELGGEGLEGVGAGVGGWVGYGEVEEKEAV